MPFQSHSLAFTLLSITFLVARSQEPSGLAKQTSSFITLEQLRRMSNLANDTRERVQSAPGTFVQIPYFRTDLSFSQKVDVYFQALMGINSSDPVLKSEKSNGYYQNTIATFQRVSDINDPFVSKVPSFASRIPRIIRDISNGTAEAGDRYDWLGGFALIFDLGVSRCYTLVQGVSEITIRSVNGTILKNPMLLFIRSNAPFESMLISTGSRNGPLTHGGSGAFLRGHANSAQRIWFSSASTATGKEISSLGSVQPWDFNEGNSKVPLTEAQRNKLEMLEDESLGIQNVGLVEVEQEYSRGLEQYDNMAFLTLSVAAILSSAAVVTVSFGPGRERMAVVIVEATVVFSFLIIVSHVCIVFVRPNTLVTDLEFRSVGNFTYQDMVVTAYSDSLVSVVGERLNLPLYLVITEAFAGLAAAGVSVTLYWSCLQLRKSGDGLFGNHKNETAYMTPPVTMQKFWMSSRKGKLLNSSERKKRINLRRLRRSFMVVKLVPASKYDFDKTKSRNVGRWIESLSRRFSRIPSTYGGSSSTS